MDGQPAQRLIDTDERFILCYLLRAFHNWGLMSKLTSATLSPRRIVFSCVWIGLLWTMAVRGWCTQDDPLSQLLSDLNGADPQARARAAQAIAKSRDPRAVDPLISALMDPDHDLQKEAASTLRGFWGPRVNDAFIAALHDSSNVEVQRTAAQALAVRGDPRAVDYLVPLLASHDSQLVQSVIEALAMIGTPGAVDALLAVYKRPHD